MKFKQSLEEEAKPLFVIVGLLAVLFFVGLLVIVIKRSNAPERGEYPEPGPAPYIMRR